MKLDIDKDWLEKMAAKEGDLEIGVGRRRDFPAAYGGCRCACHRSDLMHCMPCCHPTDDDFKCMDADVRKYLGIETYDDIVKETSDEFAHRIREIMKGTRPMSDKQQAAFTKPTSPYPGYINVTREGDDVTVSLRGDARENGDVGPLSTLKLTWQEWRQFLDEIEYRL
ncbi:hypothetical protein DTW90_18395 [Neorhizobium sp. P12A]|uniref:hypothetical protein n=1 Tax=Neorhizobium sp. P12A TaxID=2268027 RepID=UPI0011EBC5B9|nr:hypothetical protein [Neorhizobium sp. P12A]KAA0697401.1 hypothetical protein DTW90_18395 [Neorhizobium sp. P12A]